MSPLLQAVLVALLVSLTVMPGLIAVLRKGGVMDVPNSRSSHHLPTPRGGGLGVAVAATVGLVLASDLSIITRAALIGTAGACGLLGLYEDVRGVTALKRLGILFVIALSLIPWFWSATDGSLLLRLMLTLLAVFWLVAYVNVTNFMDGINGLAAGHACVTGVAWLVVGWGADATEFAVLGAIIAAAAGGFLPYNAITARVFLGDVGSYFLGGLIAAGTVLGLALDVPPEAVLAPLAVFLADTGLTLVRRVARRESWYQAHREHYYQLLTSVVGGSHSRATLSVLGFAGLCSLAGGLAVERSPLVRTGAIAVICAVLIAYIRLPRVLS